MNMSEANILIIQLEKRLKDLCVTIKLVEDNTYKQQQKIERLEEFIKETSETCSRRYSWYCEFHAETYEKIDKRIKKIESSPVAICNKCGEKL